MIITAITIIIMIIIKVLVIVIRFKIITTTSTIIIMTDRYSKLIKSSLDKSNNIFKRRISIIL